jgi:hypothetical protein
MRGPRARTAGAEATARTSAQQQAEIASSGLTSQQQTAANQYREAFQQESRLFYAGEAAFRKAMALTGTPQGDTALAFAYMKMLDETGSVREGEQQQVRDATSLFGRAQALYMSMLTGEKLTPETRQDILIQARNMYTAMSAEQRQRVQRYSAMAATSRIPTHLIVRPPAEDLQGAGKRILSSDPTAGAPLGR